MAHLLSLNLSKNQLTTESLEKFKEAPLKFLQVLDLSHNRIEEYAVDFPMLRELYLNNNQLSAIKLNAEGCVLKKLDVRDKCNHHNLGLCLRPYTARFNLRIRCHCR